MSNKRGSNTGADAIALQFKASTQRGAADLLSSCRIVASKSGVASPVLDTWWMGPGAAVAPPVADIRTNQVFVYNGRVYVHGWAAANAGAANTNIYSAPINGPNVGPVWRGESSPPTATGTTGAQYGMAQAGGFIYLLILQVIWYAPIQADGTFGAWVKSTGTATANSQILFGFTDASGSYLYVVGGETTALTKGCKINADGSLPALIAGGNQTAQRGHGGIYFTPSGLGDGNGTIWVIGGFDGVNPQLTVQSAPVTGGNGTIGVWANAATGLPAARSNGAFSVYTIAGATWLYFIGGSSAGAPTANATTTIYRILAAGLGGAWTTDATALGVAQVGGGVSQQAPGAVVAGTVADQGEPTQTSFTGATTVTLTKINGNTAAVLSVVGSQSTGLLLTANLGTGGSAVTNVDSMTVTYNWGAVAAIGGAALVDGDVVTITVYVCDQNTGAISGASTTQFKIGQAPTLSSLLPGAGITTGKPTASMAPLPGAGGGPIVSWQITVKIGATVYFDSGVRYDSLYSVLVNLAPVLATATAYTFAWTATSNDTLFNGATNTATSTLAVTPTLAPPAAPTGLTVTADNPNGALLLAWVNPAPAANAGSRVYYRRNGSSIWAWSLLCDGPLIDRFTAMDQIALGVAYDFAVSQLDLAAVAESAMSIPALINADFEDAGATVTLFKSLGTGTLGSLAAWTTDLGVPTIAANVASLPPASTQIRGGHIDTTDCTYTCRVVTGATGSPQILVHATGSATYITAWLVLGAGTGSLNLGKNFAGVFTTVATTGGQTFNAATAYWLRIVAAGTTYTATAYADTAGAIGALIATAAGTIADTTLQAGQVGMRNDSATGTQQFGGAFANVCTLTGPMANGWSPDSSDWTKFEPAFAWSKVSPYSGLRCVSIYAAAGATGGATAWVAAAPFAAGPAPQIAGQLKATGTIAAFMQIDSSGVSANVTADGTWRLITANLTAIGAGSAFRCMASTGVGTAYYDLVSVNLPAAANVKIDPSAYGCFLHIAGQGSTYKVPLSFKKGTLAFPSHLDAALVHRFGQLAPVARYGPANYKDIQFQAFLKDLPTLKQLIQLLQQAQLGNVIYYRDGFGAMFTCGLDPSQGPLSYSQPLYRYVPLKFVQVPNGYSPSLAQGSAQGIPAQVSGSVPPLDPVEQLV
jgi:hypothetical protein